MPEFRSRFIIEDSRKSDRKKGLQHDLTVDFVEKLISSNTCAYCGEDKLLITIDRIDNDVGHTDQNIVAACIRCNMLRGSMPYSAWINICEALRDTREKGLFSDWTGGINKHRRVV